MTQRNSRINVFIVDDDKNILRLYSLLCKFNGFKVVGKANNGIEAVEKLTNSIIRPDVILMDYHMPIINGIEASKLILNLDKSFKILMISADASIREEALSNGIIDFYEKSYNFKNLCQKIKRVYNLSK
ncbi:MAG: response regulator [Candidatus Hodarchaeota archaeon]